MSTSMRKFKENCEIINLVDSSILHKEFREFRDSIERRFKNNSNFNPKDPSCLSIAYYDGPLTFKNEYVLVSVHLGEFNDEFKMVIDFKPTQTSQNSKFISPLESSLLSGWDKKLKGYVIDDQIELLSDFIKEGFKRLMEIIEDLKNPLVEKRLSELEKENERLNSVTQKQINSISELDRSLKIRNSFNTDLRIEIETLKTLFMGEIRIIVENFNKRFDIESHVNQIPFPNREETYNERHLGQGKIYKTTSSVRNYSFLNYLSIYQGELILVTEVYNWHESGPCDTPGSVFSRYICHIHDGQCFTETFLDSEIITSLPKIPLKDIK
ncbi:MAG: hypothetical protein O3B20_01395 [Bacteroidetes bacterium]|nr:hypothetical protein [Bacteroidota bacterium]MDA1198719.1 hypothetical protein [Bacteroidota bacterium]